MMKNLKIIHIYDSFSSMLDFVLESQVIECTVIHDFKLQLDGILICYLIVYLSIRRSFKQLFSFYMLLFKDLYEPQGGFEWKFGH